MHDTLWDVPGAFPNSDSDVLLAMFEQVMHVGSISAEVSTAFPEGEEDVVIAVMGVTGAGKSTFIKTVSGRNDVVVGDSLFSGMSVLRGAYSTSQPNSLMNPFCQKPAKSARTNSSTKEPTIFLSILPASMTREKMIPRSHS